MCTIKNTLEGLTRQELLEWAGSKIYHRGEDYVKHVSQLSRTENGALAAWVSGSDRYATSVSRQDGGELHFDCSCPYDGWGPCKHVIAVLLAAIARQQQNKAIPLLDPEDDLFILLFDDSEEWAGADNNNPDTYLISEKDTQNRMADIASFLSGKSREALLALVIDLANKHPGVARQIRDAAQLETGHIDKVIRALRKDILKLTAEEAWFDSWRGRGDLPDYSPIEQQFQMLLDSGYPDAVLTLGEVLWEEGKEQVEQSQDEGETAMAIAACLDVVLQALPLTSLTPSEQLLWLIRHGLEDEFDLLTNTDEILNDSRYTEVHWHEVATALEKQLAQTQPRPEDFQTTYHRTQFVSLLCDAYARSGQQQQVIPLLEQEADRTKNYQALVEALLETGEQDRARQWCIHGFNKTIHDAPGIARGLQQQLRQLAEETGQFDLAAAYWAESFFAQPSKENYVKLRKAATKANSWPAVRDGILGFLQTGQRPIIGDQTQITWPLPEPEAAAPKSGNLRSGSFPDHNTLIEIALLEERHDDAIAHYQPLIKTQYRSWGIDQVLAQAVKASHPAISLQIWQSIVDRLIGQTKPKAYQEAATYLRQMRAVYQETHQPENWKGLITRLRTEHKAKRRLMEVLDMLEKS